MIKFLILLATLTAVLGNEQYPPRTYTPSNYAEPHYSPQPYAMGYKIDDGYGNNNYRKEEGDSYGNKKGAYGYTDAYGVYRYVEYVADENGFRVNIKTNEPGTKNEDPADVYITALEPPQYTNPGAPQKYASNYQASTHEYQPASTHEYQPASTHEYQPASTHEYQPAPPQYKPAPPQYKPAPPQYKPAPPRYQPQPHPQYQPQPPPHYKPAPQYKSAPPQYHPPSRPQYQPQPPPQYKPAPRYQEEVPEYQPALKYVRAAVHSAQSKPEAQRYGHKRSSYSPEYYGDMYTSSSNLKLSPSVEYAKA